MLGTVGDPYVDAVLQPHEIERALADHAPTPTMSTSPPPAIVAQMTDAGVEVTYCLVTDGQAGGFDLTIARPAMAAIRREEQTKAAAEVGVTDLIFLGRMDGEVVFDMSLRHDLTRVIRQVRPQVVITHPPRCTSRACTAATPTTSPPARLRWAAVYPDSRNPFAFPELLTSGFEPWPVDEIWLMNHPDSNAVRRHHRRDRTQDCGDALPRQPTSRPRRDGSRDPSLVPDQR